MEWVLARLVEILEPRMRRGVLNHDRLKLLGHEAGQPLVQPHAHVPHALGPQPHGRRQHQVCPIRFE